MTLMEIRTSERKSFGWCPQQWWWAYVEMLSPTVTSTPLWFGSLVHIALAKWYLKGLARGPHPAETFEAELEQERRVAVRDEDGERAYADGRELGVAMLLNYVETFGQDERWDIIATESTHALIFRRAGDPFLRYLFALDGILRDLETGLVWLLEHKTAAQIKTAHLRMDNQAGTYFAAAPLVLPLSGLLRPGEKIQGILYNFLRKAIPDARQRNVEGLYLNQNGTVSKVQPAPYFRRLPVYRTEEEQETQLRRMIDEAWYLEQMRAGNPQFPVTKTPGDHCAWCPFRIMCELDESGDADAVEAFKASMMTHQDPYQTYRKDA